MIEETLFRTEKFESELPRMLKPCPLCGGAATLKPAVWSSEPLERDVGCVASATLICSKCGRYSSDSFRVLIKLSLEDGIEIKYREIGFSRAVKEWNMEVKKYAAN